MEPTTLRQLIEEHSKWLDLPIVVYRSSTGDYDYVGCSGRVYLSSDGNTPVVVFAGN